MNCWLKSTVSKYPSIELKDKQTLVIGRNRATKIRDARVSRRQLEATLNFGQQTLLIKQTGPNDSGVNGKVICMGLTATAKEGDTVELSFKPDLTAAYTYRVDFDSESPDVSPHISAGIKRQNVLPVKSSSSGPVKIPKMFLPKTSTTHTAGDFRKASLSSKGNWESIKGDDFFVYFSDESISDSKPYVGAFDMDGTLIKTKSGRVFPKDEHDWIFRTSTIITKLQTFFSQHSDFKFVIFTNQAGIKKSSDIPPFKRKIEIIVRQIGIPILVCVGTKKDEYRKPMTGAWDAFVQKFNEGIVPDLQKSFYCGDAAGRPRDHARSDRLFALNIGIEFKTPEEFFEGGKRPQFSAPLFSPKDFINGAAPNVGSNSRIQFSHGQHEMILMVGYPASGKSTFVKSVLIPKGYVQINRDTLKTTPKCLQVAEAALKDGKKVVIDNTNPSRKDREVFIKLGKQHRVTVRCFRVMVDHAHALHNNKFRYLIGDLSASVPDVAFNSFKSSFQEPSSDEGYDEIIPVYFVPDFQSDERATLYEKYLLDK